MLRIAAGAFLRNHGASLIKENLAGYATCKSPKVAVVMSGCGLYDGTEVHEGVSVLSHLTRNDVVPISFAPYETQLNVINHLKEEVDPSHKRMAMVEATRITRCPVKDIKELVNNIECFDAVIFPGGFGVAKNLSDYTLKGCYCSVIPEVESIILGFHKAKKPQGFICISPILAARVLCDVTITLGKNSCDRWPYRAAIEDAKKMGATVELRECNETSFDRKNLILSSPGYMYDGKYHEIDDGIGNMIRLMITLLKKGELKPLEKCPQIECKHEQ